MTLGSVRQGRGAWLAAALVAAFALTGARAPAAQAGTWVVHSCHRDQSLLAESGLDWFGYYIGYVNGQRHCPDPGLTLSVFSPAAPSQQMAWQFSYSGARQLPSLVRMRLHGGDTAHGVEYGIQECPESSFEHCPLYFNFGERGPQDDEHADDVVEIDVRGKHGIVIVANCVEVGCHTERDLAVSDIELVFEDTTAPTFSVASPLHPEAFSGDAPPWIQPRLEPIQITADDGGAGMGSASATLDAQREPFWEDASGCDLSAFVDASWSTLCGGLYYNKPIDLTGLADGSHTITLDGIDGAGNRADRRTLNFRIDGTPPDPLDGLHVTSDPVTTAANWTTAPTAKVHWDAPKPDSGSPITAVHYRLEAVPRTPGTLPQLISDPATTGDLRFPHEGAFRVAAWPEDAAGNVGDKEYRAIGWDNDVPAPPTLATNRWLSKQDLLQGATQTWAPPVPQPELESGICGYATDVSRLRDGDPGRDIAVAAPKTAWAIPGPLVDGRHYVHVRAVSCAGRVSKPVAAAVDVDTTAPVAELADVPAATWASTAVIATLSATDSRSGADRVRWSLDGGALQIGPAGGAEIPVPEGVHTIEYSAVDVAGNVSEPQRRTVQIDTTAPQTSFEPRDADEPAVVHATAKDALSGVERAWIEMRADGVDGAQWQRIGPITEPAAPATEAQLTGELPDEAAPAGRYALRVAASDRAGNSTDSGGQRPLAEPPSVTLPVRAPVALQVAIGRTVPTCVTARGNPCRVDRPCPSLGCTRGSVIDASAAGAQRVLRYVEQGALVGSLTAADGQALAGMTVEVLITPRGGPSSRHELRTGPDGRFQESLAIGASRVVTIRFAGTAQLAAATASASLAVRSGVTLKLSRRLARGGRTITFSGQIAGATGVSLAGKFVTVQWARRGHGWVATGPAVRADAQGRFQFPWELSPVSHRSRIEFRAWVPSDGAWPFEDGGSTSRFLTVVP